MGIAQGSWRLLAAGLLLLTVKNGASAQSNFITLEPIFIDTEKNYGVGMSYAQRPGMVTEFYFEEGLFDRLDIYLGSYNNPSGHSAGTIYVYRYEAKEMGGAAMGYNHVGNSAFFHPTILLPASSVPELHWVTEIPISTEGVVVESAPYIADRDDIPSLALSQEFSGFVLNDHSCRWGLLICQQTLFSRVLNFMNVQQAELVLPWLGTGDHFQETLATTKIYSAASQRTAQSRFHLAQMDIQQVR